MNTIAITMQNAVAAIQRRDFDVACELAERALRLQPKSPQILQVLGVAQAEGGDVARGLRTMEKALGFAPEDTALRINVAKAAYQAGQHRKVERLCKPLGQQTAALHLRALAAKELGEFQRAISLFEAALSVSPNDAQVLNNLGNAHLAAGNADEATAILQRARIQHPKSAHVLLNLGRAQTLKGQFDEALPLFREAARLAPQDPEILFELGRSLVEFSLHDEALPVLAEAARRGVRDAEVFNLIGTSYAALELRDEAEKAYRMALTLDSENSRTHLNLGLLLEQDNRLDDLAELISQAERKKLANGDIDYLRALLLQRSGKLDEALERVSRSEPEFLDPVLRDEFIGKLADRLGKLDIAFEAFSRMNAGMARRPEARGYNGTEHRAVIAARTAVVTHDWYEGWHESPPHNGGPIPVMLGGFLRSGTTLLDTILMSHPAAHVREEEGMIARLEDAAGDISNLSHLAVDEIIALRNAYYAELQRNGPVPEGHVLIDKYPLMTLRATYLHRAFPEAKYIFALRHPCDVVLSCWMQNFRVTRAMASFLTLENAARLYDAAMTHWIRCREIMPLDVHTIRYEDMVNDLEGQLRPLIEFIGLAWTGDLLDHPRTARDRGFIRTPSYAQVTEKLYTRSSGRWTNYREHLEPILPILAPWIERFGYSASTD